MYSQKLVGAFQKYLSDMEKLGYFTTYKILNAMDFGIPQKRKEYLLLVN